MKRIRITPREVDENRTRDLLLKLNIIEDLKESPDVLKYLTIRSHINSFRSYFYNYKHLRSEFKHFHFLASDMDFWTNRFPKKSTLIAIESSLFNYVSISVAIIQYSRRYLKYLSGEHKQEFKALIEEKNQNISFQFLESLRNYVNHKKDIALFGRSEFGINRSIRTSIAMKSELLLMDRDHWTKNEIEFIKASGKWIEIEHIVHEYHLYFLKMQYKFRSLLWASNIELLRSLKNSIAEIIAECPGESLALVVRPLIVYQRHISFVTNSRSI
jgi:hypothetical protein